MLMDLETRLKNYRYDLLAIKNIEKELKKLERETQTDIVQASLHEHPYTKSSYTIEGHSKKHAEKVRHVRNLLIKRRDECLDNRAFVEEFMQQEIDDRQMQVMIELYYIHGNTWLQVAMKVGYQDARGPQRKVEEFLVNAKNAK